jgi:hypothetical protein
MRSLAKTTVPGIFCIALSLSIAIGGENASSLSLPTPTDKPATLTFEQLRDGIKQYRAEFWALEVEYEYHSEGKGVPWLKYHFAMKGEKRLRDQLEAGGLLYGEAYDGNNAQTYNRDTQIASFQKEKQTWTDLDFYADALGVGVSDEHRAKGISLTSILDASVLEWTVQPSLEIVDGAECHVLVSNSFRNRFWIDPAIGFAMRFQEVYQVLKDAPNSDWPLHARYLYRDFEKLPSDVYLPKTIEITAYTNATSPRNLWNQVSFTQAMNATKLAVGQQVDDSVFRFNFLPATTVMDRVNDRFYRIGNSGEELDILVGKGLEELTKSRSKTSLVLILNGVLVVGFLLFMAFRRLQQKGLSAKSH